MWDLTVVVIDAEVFLDDVTNIVMHVFKHISSLIWFVHFIDVSLSCIIKSCDIDVEFGNWEDY